MAAKFPWFSHDAEARNEKKIRMLRVSFGNNGYAWYFMLLEILRVEHDFQINLNDETTRNYVLDQLGIERKEFESFIALCVKVYLFKFQDGYLWSDGLKTRMITYENKCNTNRKNASKGGNQAAINRKLANATPNATANGIAKPVAKRTYLPT